MGATGSSGSERESDMIIHPAAPLTDATRPYYEAIAALRVDGWTQCQATRLEIAGLTQKIWREVRNGNGNTAQHATIGRRAAQERQGNDFVA
jgi:hypothetical protein